MCMICFVETGRATGCPDNHHVCKTCMHTHIRHHLEDRPDAWVRCPCGQGAPLDTVTSSTAHVAQWIDGLVRLVRDRRGQGTTFQPVESVGVALCHEARDLSCPTCGRGFVDFEGCAAIGCVCGSYFCALCLQRFASSALVHEHVRRCLFNPTEDASYYVPIEACKSLWLARARQRLRRALWRLLRIDGLFVALSAIWAVHWRDPALVHMETSWLHTRPRLRFNAKTLASLVAAAVVGGTIGYLKQTMEVRLFNWV